METILIAGGTGQIGKRLSAFLLANNYKVLLLTRKPTQGNLYQWDPYKDYIDLRLPFDEIAYIINLTGEGIGDKTWSKKRRHDILQSRVVPSQFIERSIDKFSNLKHLLQISGATCYGQNTGIYNKEEDAFGNDFLSQVVKEWEARVTIDPKKVQFTLLRAGVVFYEGGALKKMIQPVKINMAANFGNGEQIIPWVSMDDVCKAFLFFIKHNKSGIYNLVASNISQKSLNLQAATYFNKKLWLPNLPKEILRLFLGEMSELITESYAVDHQKIIDAGFHFTETSLQDVLFKYYS